MPSHHFISYSSADAQDFALRLCDTLAAGPPSFPVWLDKRKLQAGEDWDAQIVEAIKTCVSMLFVMTRDSVEDESVCKNEWVSALSYKKLIVAIKLHHDAELPFRLASRRFIDFTGEFEPALARLRERLQWLDSPAGTADWSASASPSSRWPARRAASSSTCRPHRRRSRPSACCARAASTSLVRSRPTGRRGRSTRMPASSRASYGCSTRWRWRTAPGCWPEYGPQPVGSWRRRADALRIRRLAGGHQ